MAAIKTKHEYYISAIDPEIALRARETLVDGFGNRLKTQVCDGPVPCRSCLRLTTAGDEVMLLAHSPFTSSGPYAEVGPIFIHSQACDQYPSPDFFPDDFSNRRMVLRAYSVAGEIADAQVCEPGEHNDVIDRLFENSEVEFIHARNVAYGCYLFRIDRKDARGD